MSRVSGAGEEEKGKEEDAKRIDAVDAGISHYCFSSLLVIQTRGKGGPLGAVIWCFG